jgi:Questin oxidase-like
LKAGQHKLFTALIFFTEVYCAAAAQHPPNTVKYDFVTIHAVNCSIFFSAILTRPWISTRAKVRLLEWKGRMDLVVYTSRHSPRLYLNEITGYPANKNWDEVFRAGNNSNSDDGHLVKLIRAIAHGERISKTEDLTMKGDAWLKAGNMGMSIFLLMAFPYQRRRTKSRN